MSAPSSELEAHIFEPAPPDAARSPCPALNALSAHGYLPRSGRDISFMQLFSAVRAVYNTSVVLSLLLTIAGFLLCGHNGRPTIPFVGTIDLSDFARHGGIEHDASLGHADAEPGEAYAPTAPSAELLDELLKEAKGRDALSLDDIARVRSRREVALALHGKPLDFVHAEITRGEVSLLLSVLGDGETVPTDRVRTWMGEDRLPDGWHKPERSHGLLDTLKMSRKIEALITKEKDRINESLKVGKQE